MSAPSPTPAVASADLRALLRDRFGHEDFRPSQEEVCRAVAEGSDALLVMPTGAGKSLCYQLPGLARGGTTLVVSPLIALMEDQVAKLRELDVRAERIHSGRDRLESREVCRRYLAGDVDFLFVAPERLQVRGFPEFLARRPPSLVAVDEAHCISQWGHDFRPDYRLLGDALPGLRPAPILALTATATPRVQKDILAQLGMSDAERFIRGFRRENLAVEVVEAPPSARPELVRSLLSSEDHRPAIVYAPSRKETEDLARLLETEAGLAAAAYHAGLPSDRRDRVQAAFLGGDLEVIVATIAFGMGVDKPDVRAVVHTALPGTLEGYYQEIGRAGRDGLPSRALLLWSWADRRMQDWFFERTYPEVPVLETVLRTLGGRALPEDELRHACPLEEDVFEQALEKLWIHDGVALEFGRPGEPRRVRPGSNAWRRSYTAQRRFREEQIADMVRYAGSSGCRMSRLVEHFGDRSDHGRPCGHCDQCSPSDCAVRTFREPTRSERTIAFRLVAALREWDGQSTGRLFKEVCADERTDRRGFELVVEALTRAGALRVTEDSFEKDGRSIRFQRAHLDDGAGTELDDLDFEIVESIEGESRRRPVRPSREEIREAADEAVLERLREWRTAEARRRRVPAFRILPNRTLEGLAAALPGTEEELLAVSGIGPAIAGKYGEDLLRLVARP